MNVNEDLLGKTITGVIAAKTHDNGPREIWMLQFADGSHVEFVSPGARRALRRGARAGHSGRRSQNARQTCLKSAANYADNRPVHTSGQPMRLANSRFMQYQRDPEAAVQLTLNVA